MKYEAAGLETRAWALHALGRTSEAIADLRQGLQLVRPTGDPAMFLRAAAALLALDGDDEMLGEASATADRIAHALPDGPMRRAFETSGPVCLVRKLARHPAQTG